MSKPFEPSFAVCFYHLHKKKKYPQISISLAESIANVFRTIL